LLNAQAGASEAADCLLVQIFGGLITAQQGARARLGPQRPVGAGGAGGLREPVESLRRADRLPAAGRGFDQRLMTAICVP
jgi:hypothetical protein